jgi:hypothetical protein
MLKELSFKTLLLLVVMLETKILKIMQAISEEEICKI